ncbi:MAG: heavy-metal-associated domain-containing protein [Longimicrobiales bacterium]
MATATLKISGMTCQHCVHTVTTALQGVAGVAHADVDLTKKRATVEYDATRTNPRSLANVVMDEGYMAEEVA